MIERPPAYGARPGGSIEYYTPRPFFDALDEEFKFGLDPCAATWGPKLCPNNFGVVEDGLEQSWAGYGPVFMNPPYGREVPKWMAKARTEANKGITVVCLIIPRTDAAWWHDSIGEEAELRFVRNRLYFTGSDGNTSRASFQSVVVILGPEADEGTYLCVNLPRGEP